MIKVEMLSTGDEVLSGQIVDTNASWLADYLFHQGLPMSRRNTVGDNFADLVSVLQERSQHADVLIVNGGLGPTGDDLSAQAAAEAAGEGLVLHPEWLVKIEKFFADRGRPMAPSNRKQAMLPTSSEMIDNPIGTACGFMMQLNRCLMFFTPGVPSEFKMMVEQQIVPQLRQHFTLPEPPVCLRLTTFGRSESDLAQELDTLALPEGVVMGYRSSMPIIELKLTGPAQHLQQMELLWQQVKAVAGENIIFEGTEGLPARVVRQLLAQHKKMVVSEQFTGGLLSLQLNRAQAPLKQSVLPELQTESLAQTCLRAGTFAQAEQAITLVIGACEESNEVNIALGTGTDNFALRIRLDNPRHNLQLRQELVAMVALNMLRRWQEGESATAQHGWITVVERIG